MIFQNGRFYGGVEFDNKFTNGCLWDHKIHYADLNGKDWLETSSGIGYVTLNRFETTQFYSGDKLGHTSGPTYLYLVLGRLK
jgi:hypothetical protein